MDITEEERGWALAIQEALLKQDEELGKRITDFEYLHHALIAKDKVDKALTRIHRLETFRREHGISTQVTAEDAMQVIRKFEASSPGMILSFGKQETTYLSTWNYSQFYPSKYNQDPEEWKNCFAAFYYLFDAMQPDVAAIRSGIVMVCEVEGLGWKNFSLEMEKHAAHLYQDAYPIRIQNMTMLHSRMVFKAMYALCKPFLSKKVKAAIVMNGKVEVVQEQYPKNILGTMHGGTQTTSEMEDEMIKGLKLRFANMETFKLAEATIQAVAAESTGKEVDL
jgi:CRAL/TRIO domain